ncbi:hypothetical protein L3X38_013296 [Prunus dulcis]|uniref:Uncharacterized protein n=1 Tax=Prunus dulcis TaxID=3755 RepID=A0AAD4WL84_PRUDU|nr:hypothetical protein L3X38_013296 [Prunus dulcis]
MRKIREEKMSLVSKVGFGDGLSPLEVLSKTICSIFKVHQEKQEHSSESPKKGSSLYFNFLNDTSSPNNTTPKKGNGPAMIERKEAILESPSSHDEDDDGCQVLHVDHAEERSELTFQLQIPDLVKECFPHPKKRRSSSPTNINSIILFGQKITMSTTGRASTRGSSIEFDQIHQEQASTRGSSIEFDQIHQEQAMTPDKKKKKVKFSVNMNSSKGKGKNKSVPEPIHELPEEFKQVILGKMNGTKLQLLAQKSLFEADIKPGQGRLLLPREQTTSKNPKKFLKHNEKARLDKYKMQVSLIDPVLQQEDITLAWWKLSKKPKKRSFVLTHTWNHIVNKHHLDTDDLVQVWSFRAINPNFKHDDLDCDCDRDNNCRDVQDYDNVDDDLNDDDGQLHLALVLVRRDDHVFKEEGNNSGGREVVGGSICGSCSPENFESSSPEKIGSSSSKVGEKRSRDF